MLIAIWEHGSKGKDNVLITLLASAAVFMYPCRVTLLENTTSQNMIGDMIFGNSYSELVREETVYNTGRNREETVAKTVADRYERRIKKDILLEIIDNSMYYIPQLSDVNQTSFDYIFNDNLYGYLEMAEEMSDITMINAKMSQSLSTPAILDTADYILIIMPPSPDRFVEFLDQYHSVLGKCFFVIMEPYYLSKEVKRVLADLNIPKNKIIFLPCTDYLENHIVRGKVVDYVKSCINCSKASPEYTLISRVKKTIQLVMGHNPSGTSFRIRQLSSILNSKDFDGDRYKRIIPDVPPKL